MKEIFIPVTKIEFDTSNLNIEHIYFHCKSLFELKFSIKLASINNLSVVTPSKYNLKKNLYKSYFNIAIKMIHFC